MLFRRGHFLSNKSKKEKKISDIKIFFYENTLGIKNLLYLGIKYVSFYKMIG